MRYAKSYANDAVNLSKNGPYKIREELLKQGINEIIIEEIIYSLDEEIINNNLMSIIEKKNRLNNHYSMHQLKMKLNNELINLGYDKDKINEYLNKILKEDTNIAKKEYEKLKKKYSKKYSGLELKYKLKQAMYQKGFNYSEDD